MNIATLLVLLQAIVSLYSNPQLAQNATLKAQVDLMANQVIALTNQTLSQPANTQLGSAPTSSVSISLPTSTDNTQPIVVTVNPPIQQIITPVVTPTPVVVVPSSSPVLGAIPESCTLSVKPICNIATKDNNGGYHYNDCVPGEDETDPRTGQFIWTSSGIPSSTMGKLYLISVNDVSSPSGMKSLNNEVLIQGSGVVGGGGTGYQIFSKIDPITQAQGVAISNTPGGCGFQSDSCVFKLTLDQATCTASYMGINPDGSQFVACTDEMCHGTNPGVTPPTCPDPKFACQ
jgi:hypothetical protein